MSVRSNGSGDKLTASGLASLGTSQWTMTLWHNRIADRDAQSGLVCLTDHIVQASATMYFLFRTASDGTTLHCFFNQVGVITAGVALPSGWHGLALQRNAGDDLVIKVYGSTGESPIASETVTDALQGLDLGSLTALVLGEYESGDWVDAEMENCHFHLGAALSDAEIRAQLDSYNFTPGSGTNRCQYRLKTVTADADGINDSSGNDDHLSNTGWVDGASTPAPLAAAAARGVTRVLAPQQRYAPVFAG